MLSEYEFAEAFQELLSQPENAELKSYYALYNNFTMPNFEISSMSESLQRGNKHFTLNIGFLIHDVNDSYKRILHIMQLIADLLIGTAFDCELNQINAFNYIESSVLIIDIDARTRQGVLSIESEVYQNIKRKI